MPAAASPETATPVSEKKRKPKSTKSEKKRSREEDPIVDKERKHKKAKSVVASVDVLKNGEIDSKSALNQEVNGVEGKMHKKKKNKDDPSRTEPIVESEAVATTTNGKKQKKKKDKLNGIIDGDAQNGQADSSPAKKEKRKKKKHRETDNASLPQNATEETSEDAANASIANAMGVNGSESLDSKPIEARQDEQAKSSPSKKEKRKKRKEKHGEASTADILQGTPKAISKDAVDASHTGAMDIDEAPSKIDEPSRNKQSEPSSTKKEKRKKKKHVEAHAINIPQSTAEATSDVQDASHTDAMDVDPPTRSSKVYGPSDIPSDPEFPFFRQTVSLYEPIYPNGWAQPVTSAQHQHLQHLLNKYVPSLRGVLLDYKNVALGSSPGRLAAATTDHAPTTLKSRDEYAVGFGWITADVDLFVPRRGAFMEGSVNLQTEGHIGVVCFGKFNASIEARRLPPAWKWVPNEDSIGLEEGASVVTADDHGVVRQIHSTGYWVDGDERRINGRIRFRIRNFDAGTSGETTYLSLEGTMLDKESEMELVKEEARTAQMRREKKGGRRYERRRAPEFSMTRFESQEANGSEKS